MLGLTNIWKKLTAQQYTSSTVGVLGNIPAPRGYLVREGMNSFGSWIAAACDINARAVAANTLRLYVKERKGKRAGWSIRGVPSTRRKYLGGSGERMPSRRVVTKSLSWGDDFVEVVDHPILDLLYKVNPWQCGFELMNITALQLQLTGNAYWLAIQGAYGVPESLWVLPPDRVWVKPSKSTWIGGYEYRPKNQAESITLATEEVAHFKLPNPRDPWYGMGYVERNWCAVQQVASVGAMDLALYENHARPDYAIIIRNASATPDQLDRYSEKVNTALRGVGKQGKPWTMTGDVDLRPLNFMPKDMAGREELIEEIAAGFGVPVSMLLANDPNLASAEIGYATWRAHTIAPMCKLIEDIINQNILPMFDIGDDSCVAFDDPVPANKDRDSIVHDRYVRLGARSINEVREDIGDEPFPDDMADALLFNGQPLGAAPTPQMMQMMDRPRDDPKPKKEEEETKQDKSVNVEYIINEIMSRMAYNSFTKEAPKICAGHKNPISHKYLMTKDNGVGDSDDTVRDDENEKIIRKLTDDLGEVFRDQVEAVVKSLSGEGLTGQALVSTARDEIRRNHWVERIAAVTDPHIRAQLSRSGAASMASVGVGARFDAVNPEVQRWVNTSTTRLANEVNGTTEIRVVNLLGDSLTAGETVPQMAAKIRDTVGTTQARAEMIARTESARAYEQGRIEGWKQSGVVAGKQWLLAPDACEFCRAIAREYSAKSIPLDEPFRRLGQTIEGVSGGTLNLDYSDVDGAPLHPGCRCTTTAVMA